MSRNEKNVLVLQGGGALGAYQAGAYEALAEGSLAPDWVAGISIGALNGSIIAGNPPERRVERLRQFWELVSSRLLMPPILEDDISRRFFVEASAALVASTGVPGFFEPRVPSPLMLPQAAPDAVSIYDTRPLRETLLDLVDFDYLNSGATRFSVGAVEVHTGNMRYFDTGKGDTITPEHVMASGALPPGLPAITIEGELYWDGGLVSNTPLQYVLDYAGPREDMCIFQVDLFSARGPLPKTLLDVAQREKDIRYSSRTRLNTDMFRRMQSVRRAIRRLDRSLPEDVRATLDWKLLSELGCDAAITIVHLIHRRAAYSSHSNDYEFSRYSVDSHWHNGRLDVENTLHHPEWINREPPKQGVKVLDCTRDLDAGEVRKSA